MGAMGLGGFDNALVDGTAQFAFSSPANGFAYTAPTGTWHVLLTPAAALANGTVTLPIGFYDGQLFDIRTSQTITAVTWVGQSGQTIVNAPAGLAAGLASTAIFQVSTNSWYFG